MPDPIRPGNISFDVSFKKTAASKPVDEDTPLRIAILGGFGGNADTSASRAIRVDCDNFDAVCAQLGASLQLPAGAETVTLTFAHLDDFHPDRLLQKIPSLAKLTELRARVADPATADAAAAELRNLLGGTVDAPSAAPTRVAPDESASDLIARLLGKPASGSPASAPAGAKSIVEQLIAKAVAPVSVPAATPAQTSLLSTLDAELSRRLRAVMHHPDFQSLESAWRGLDFLVRNASDNVKLHAIAITRAELDHQLATPGDLARTAIARQLAPLAPLVVLGAFSFGEKDTVALAAIARLAAALGTAFIGGADSELVGCTSFGTQPYPLDWKPSASAAYAELRRAPEAAHLGLALPRFLLRQPYAPGSDAIETFPFTELPAADAHECKLWGSSAFLCGQRLLDAFSNDGWDMELGGSGGEIGGLPVHTFKVNGDSEVTPCAEAWLTEKAAGAILARGLMPVLSVRGRDSAILVSLRSIAEPAQALAFRVG
jgi:type VI secretion system ImpC/EvpB family protein/type VI secretion system ImpB/VipA family protein